MVTRCRNCRAEIREPRRRLCDGCRKPRDRGRTDANKAGREKMRARPTTSERGYGPMHKRLRRQVAQVVASGGAVCARCGRRIVPDEPWDLGHDDNDRSRYVGPEHAACNRGTAGRRVKPSRRW